MHQYYFGSISRPTTITCCRDHVLSRWVDICEIKRSSVSSEQGIGSSAYAYGSSTRYLRDDRQRYGMVPRTCSSSCYSPDSIDPPYSTTARNRPMHYRKERDQVSLGRASLCVLPRAYQAICFPSGKAATALTHCDVAGWRNVRSKFGVSVVPLVPPFRTSQTSSEAFRRPAMT